MKKGIIKAILRGIVKSVPLGNTVLETVENYKNEDKPHNYVSIAVQLLIIGGIVYSFATKAIDIEKLIDLLTPFK